MDYLRQPCSIGKQAHEEIAFKPAFNDKVHCLSEHERGNTECKVCPARREPSLRSH